MFEPETEIGKKFTADCRTLSDSLRESVATLSEIDRHEKASRAIQSFFDGIQNLPTQLSPLTTQGTALFEIDNALLGTYGNTIFSAADDDSPMRVLLRDLAALWQRYYLFGALERLSGGVIPPGTMRFFDVWVRSGGSEGQMPEYDRLLKDVLLMLEISETLNIPAKVMLFSLMGKILVALGVSDEFAQRKLIEHEGVFRARDSRVQNDRFSEVLLCMQVLASKRKGIQDTGIDSTVLRKALRFWASRDEFLERLFRSWGWHWDHDFVSPLAMGDSIKLRDQSILFQSWSNGSAKLNIGQSYLEVLEHRKNNPTFTNVFKPIPIFVFGGPGVGKSSLLCALCYDVQMRAGRSLSLGRELQAFYETIGTDWRNSAIGPTNGHNVYTFWEDLNVTSYALFDYRGKDAQPDQWEPQLQESLRDSKGLLFLVSSEDCSDQSALRRKASWFEAILQYWMQSNPTKQHIPISLVLTKGDLTFHKKGTDLPRSSLISETVQRCLVEVFVPDRFTAHAEELQTRGSRLYWAVMSDKINNLDPTLQDAVHALLTHFEQFFDRVISVTYNFQIFLSSALPPRTPSDGTSPWGVKEPFEWTSRVLEGFYIRESLKKLRDDETQVDGEVRIIREDIQYLQLLVETINYHTAEINRLRQKPSLFQLTMKERIKFHEDERQKASDEFVAKVQVYQKDYHDPNRHRGLQLVELEIRKREQILAEIKQKRTEFEKRLQWRTLQAS